MYSFYFFGVGWRIPWKSQC